MPIAGEKRSRTVGLRVDLQGEGLSIGRSKWWLRLSQRYLSVVGRSNWVGGQGCSSSDQLKACPEASRQKGWVTKLR